MHQQDFGLVVVLPPYERRRANFHTIVIFWA
jgi:hypothetical protein